MELQRVGHDWATTLLKLSLPQFSSVQSLSCVWLCNPMDYIPPGSSVYGDSPGKNTGMGCHALLQGIFLTQESNPCLLCLLHCRQILYLLSHQGSPNRLYLKAKKYFRDHGLHLKVEANEEMHKNSSLFQSFITWKRNNWDLFRVGWFPVSVGV